MRAVHTIAQTRLFRIEELELEFENGAEVIYERMIGSPRGAVLVVPMQDDDTILMVREYAAGSERYELGLVKGRIEVGEEMMVAANREIMEEVGYGARRLEHIKSLTEAPGYFRHETHVVLARELYPEQLPGDEPEPIEVVPWPLSRLDEIVNMVACSEARTIAALYLARDYLARERRDE